jgi:hypothetical protein
MKDQSEYPKFFEYKELPSVHRPYSSQGFWPSSDDGYGYSYSYPDYDDDYDYDDYGYSATTTSYEHPEEPCIICGVDTPSYNIVDEPDVATGICILCYGTMFGSKPKESSESLYKKILKGLK